MHEKKIRKDVTLFDRIFSFVVFCFIILLLLFLIIIVVIVVITIVTVTRYIEQWKR